jgi:hypothetical protein
MSDRDVAPESQSPAAIHPPKEALLPLRPISQRPHPIPNRSSDTPVTKTYDILISPESSSHTSKATIDEIGKRN